MAPLVLKGPLGRTSTSMANPCMWGFLRLISIGIRTAVDIHSCNDITFPMAAPDNPTIRVDESLDDTDSSYGDENDRESQTTSLYSAITKYVYENGRRYHSYRYGTYW